MAIELIHRISRSPVRHTLARIERCVSKQVASIGKMSELSTAHPVIAPIEPPMIR